MIIESSLKNLEDLSDRLRPKESVSPNHFSRVTDSLRMTLIDHLVQRKQGVPWNDIRPEHEKVTYAVRIYAELIRHPDFLKWEISSRDGYFPELSQFSRHFVGERGEGSSAVVYINQAYFCLKCR